MRAPTRVVANPAKLSFPCEAALKSGASSAANCSVSVGDKIASIITAPSRAMISNIWVVGVLVVTWVSFGMNLTYAEAPILTRPALGRRNGLGLRVKSRRLPISPLTLWQTSARLHSHRLHLWHEENRDRVRYIRAR